MYLFFILSIFSFSAEIPTECQSAKEYITTIKYLREKSETVGSEYLIQQTADEVSKGCTGAAGRFINSFELLLKGGISSQDSLETAKEVAQKSEDTLQAFIAVLQNAYSPEGLDLDALAAVTVAKKLSVEFKGDPAHIKTDYETLIPFCLNNLKLTKPQCAQFALNTSQFSENYKKPVATDFINTYKYLTDKKGGDLPTVEALKLTEEIMNQHPLALENFKQTYEFALSKEGLGLTKKDALKTALKVASRTKPEK